MVAAEKFLFNLDFTGPAAGRRKRPKADAVPAPDAPTVAEPPPPPPPPTFTEAELEQAKESAYMRGREEALSDAGHVVEQNMARALTAIAEKFSDMAAAQTAANEAAAREAVEVAVAVIRKLFPEWNRRHGAEEVVAALREVTARLIEEPTLTVFVNADERETVEDRVDPVVRQTGLAVSVEVVGDVDVAPGDCRMAWNAGGAARDADRLWAEIDEILKRNLLTGEPPDADDGGRNG
ncbi:MAG: hypothetical protein ACPGO3_15870 [Magnetospiraceae bacterium]